MGTLIAFGRSLPDQHSQAQRIYDLIKTNRELRYELEALRDGLRSAQLQAKEDRGRAICHEADAALLRSIKDRLEAENAALREELSDNRSNRRRAL